MASHGRARDSRHRGTRPAGRPAPGAARTGAPLPVDEIAEVVTAALEAAGIWCEGVVVSRAGGRVLVRVTVDLGPDQIGAMSLDDVAAASRVSSDALDAADVVPGAYTLEVSTPGTERVLRAPYHFRRARTRIVLVTLTDGSQVRERLIEVSEGDDPTLVFESGRQIRYSQVARGKVEVEMSRLAEAGLPADDEGTEDDDEDGGES